MLCAICYLLGQFEFQKHCYTFKYSLVLTITECETNQSCPKSVLRQVVQPCLWTEFVLECPWKRVSWVLKNPGIWSLQLASPSKSWKTVFYCLYEPWCTHNFLGPVMPTLVNSLLLAQYYCHPPVAVLENHLANWWLCAFNALMGGRKGICLWWDAGIVICLEQAADLHMA